MKKALHFEILDVICKKMSTGFQNPPIIITVLAIMIGYFSTANYQTPINPGTQLVVSSTHLSSDALNPFPLTPKTVSLAFLSPPPVHLPTFLSSIIFHSVSRSLKWRR